MGKKKRRGKNPLELTDDIITDIINRVPDKDLKRFKCVSKSWRSLINNDSYLSHLRSQRTALLGRPFLIIQESKYVSRPRRMLLYNYWLELDSIEDGNPNPRQLRNPFNGDDHDCSRPQDVCVIASCDGLLVLEQRPSCKMVVLNPTTKKHHLVPPNPAGDHNVEFIGFGYDPVHGCYKLVTKIKHESRDHQPNNNPTTKQLHFVPPNPAGDDNVVFCGFGYDRVHYCYKLVTQIKPASGEDPLDLMVYEVNKGTWKSLRFGTWWRSKIDDFDDEDCYSAETYDHGVECVDGALYWVWEEMICFVLAEEQFHEVETPDFGEVAYNPILTDFEGRLCLKCEEPNKAVAEFWMIDMECKGSAYSWRWTKFLAISDPYAMLPPFYKKKRDLMPVCFSAWKNRVLFHVFNDLYWYDLTNKKFFEPTEKFYELLPWPPYHRTSYGVRSLVGDGIF